MKRILLLSTLSTAALAAFAAHADGFTGPGENRQPITVIEVEQLKDETEVTLVGYIVKALGDETYEFRDDTGTLLVEIDDDEWNGVEATPTLQVELTGEIDREWREAGVEVDSIRLAQAQ